MSTTLLQRYSFDGTLVADGTLNLALQNTATTLGTPTYATGPYTGTQGLVISSTGYVELPYSAPLNFTTANQPWSHSIWVYVTSDGAFMGNQLSQFTPGHEIGVYSNTATIYNEAVNQSGTRSSDLQVGVGSIINKWSHLLVTSNNNTITIYLNGTIIISGSNSADNSSNTPWNIAKTAVHGTGKFSGRVADARWYSGIVTPAIAMTPVVRPLQQFTFDNTIIGTGSLALALVNPSTTLGSTPTYISGPVSGSAIVIPNSSSYLILPYNSSLSFSNNANFSVGGWFNVAVGSQADVSLMSNFDGTNFGIELFIRSNGNVYADIWSSGTQKNLDFAGGITYGTWTHIWLTLSGTTLTLYSNGVSRGTNDVTGYSFASTAAWRINGSKGSFTMNSGAVADVRWYNIVVSPISGGYSIPVNWTINSNGFYNISSANHLDLLMNNGSIAGLTSIGSFPTNWWGSKYIQTANIIYTKLPTNIGNSSTNFTGIYDGQQYEIQNLFYNVAGTYALFGNINNCTIKNVTLGGTLNIYGANSSTIIGINYGGIVYSATNNCLIQNCKILASGTININGTFSLICNNMSGLYGIIYNCLTNYTGTITAGAGGTILYGGGGINNSYVLFCTNNNVGTHTTTANFSSLFVHTGATLVGCLISMTGSFNSGVYNAAFTFDGKAIACVNALNGNYNGSTFGGGITTTGFTESCMMAMNGTFNSSSGGAICQTGTAYNCINIMKGSVIGSPAIGGSTTKNNICAMNGTASDPYSATRDEYCILDYGFSNSTANFPVINDIWNRFNTSNYYTYYDEINFPILKHNLSYSVNNSNFTGPAPLWQIPFQNLVSTHSIFRYQYNFTNSNYDIITKNINSSNTNIKTAIPADGTNSNVLPYYLLDFYKNNSTKSIFKSNLDIIVQNNSNISNIIEASFYNNLSNQNSYQNNSNIDADSFSNSILPNSNIFKPAFNKVLKLLVPDNITIKNLPNSAIFTNIIKQRNIDKLYISSNTTITTAQRDSLFSNNLDLLLLENKNYTINLDSNIINLDTTNSLSNSITYKFNNSNIVLNSNNPIVQFQYNSNVFKAFELTSLGSASLMVYNLTNVTYTKDSNNFYQLPSLDHLLCFFNQGYRYRQTNAPSNYLTVNYKQTANFNCSNNPNLMLTPTYSGIYDGNNFEIQNLFYSTSDFSKSYNFSLFNSINNATIKNITLGGSLNVYDTRSSNIAGNINYGGLIYTANNNCIIQNCKVTATGRININGTHSLICNNMIGQYGIINNCLTTFVGPINCSYCGNILYGGAGDNKSYILFSTVNNIGDITCQRDSGILSYTGATVFGCSISMNGNFNCGVFNGGFSYNAPVIASINSMIGNYNIGSFGGAIIGVGTADYCINAMIGTVNSSGNNNGGAIAHTGLVRNCLNVMKGQINGYVFGANGANSNNVSAMFGNVTTFANTIAQYAVLDYGFSNTTAQLTVTAGSNVKKILLDSSSNINSYYKYNPNFDLPYLPSQLIYTVNNSNFIGPAPLWNNSYPNVAGNPLITPTYNYYAIRGSDEILTKLFISNFTSSNINSSINLYVDQITTNVSSSNNSNIFIDPLSIILNPQNPMKIITDKNNKKFLLKLNSINNNTTLSGASLNITEILDINFSSNQSNQYLIENSNQFLCLMAQGDSNYYNVTNFPLPSFSNGSFIQTSNINLINEINPVMYKKFTGIYDGNAFQIQNLNINEDLIFNTSINTGLFSSISNAIIKNINISGITNIVNNSNDYRTSGCDFGFISGIAENSIISDCTINTTLSNVKCMSFGGIVRKAKNSVIIRNHFNVKGNIQINEQYAGGIVAMAENTKILFNTNSMIGNINTINNILGGIYGGYSNGGNYVYGNINIMRGNLISDFLLNSIGGIQGMTGSNDNILVNTNAIFGDILSGTDKNGGIVGDALTKSTIQYNINSQKGNINGSGIVDSVGEMTAVKNNINSMKGICSQAAGMKYIINNSASRIQRNLIIMNGHALVKESDISDALAFTSFGFSNTQNILTVPTPQDIYLPDDYFKYYDDMSFSNLPVPTFSSVNSVNIDSNIFNGPAPFWGAYFPNITDNDYIYYVFTSNNLIMPIPIDNSGNSLIKVKPI